MYSYQWPKRDREDFAYYGGLTKHSVVRVSHIGIHEHTNAGYLVLKKGGGWGH